MALKRLYRPKKPLEHSFVGEHKHGAACREKVTVVIGGIRMWFSCGWPRSVHPKGDQR